MTDEIETATEVVLYTDPSELSESVELELRDAKGRYIPGKSGNYSGRGKGVKNKLTLFKQQLQMGLLSDLSDNSRAILEVAVKLALKGDKDMIKLLLKFGIANMGGDSEKSNSGGNVAFTLNVTKLEPTKEEEPKIVSEQ